MFLFLESKVKGSPNFEEFLTFLGEKIQLKGWNGYAGELDTQSNNDLFISFSQDPFSSS
jgi:hypothetical protein